MTRQEMIDAIFSKERETNWSMGTAWLEHMTDEELRAKYEEVCGNG